MFNQLGHYRMEQKPEVVTIARQLRGHFGYDAESECFTCPFLHLWYCVTMRHVDDYLGNHQYGALGTPQRRERVGAENLLNAKRFIFSHQVEAFGINREWFINMCLEAKCKLGLQ